MSKKRNKQSAPVGEVAGAKPVPPPTSPAEGAPSEQAVARSTEGKWLPGQSGNPAGRIKGARNRLTLERMALEGALREYIASPTNLEKLKKGIDRILDISILGEDKQAVAAFKILADKVLTAPKDAGDQDQGGPTSVTVVIENMTTPKPRQVSVEIDDADFHEIDD